MEKLVRLAEAHMRRTLRNDPDLMTCNCPCAHTVTEDEFVKRQLKTSVFKWKWYVVQMAKENLRGYYRSHGFMPGYMDGVVYDFPTIKEYEDEYVKKHFLAEYERVLDVEYQKYK